MSFGAILISVRSQEAIVFSEKFLIEDKRVYFYPLRYSFLLKSCLRLQTMESYTQAGTHEVYFMI